MENDSFMGIGLTQIVNHYVGSLHNGRARIIDKAILWHGVESEESKNQYVELSRAKKEYFLDWLRQL